MRILLVEDDLPLSEALAAGLRAAGFAVDSVGTKNAALAALDTGTCDLVILDLGLPDGTGFEVVRHARQRGRGIPILILTARDNVDDKVLGLDIGADDYLVKPIALKELAARSRALIRRGHGAAQPMLSAGGLDLDTVGRQAFHRGQPVPLTAREWSTLEYFASRPGRIVSKEQLLQALCGADADITINAIEMLVHRLRGKVEGFGVNLRTVRGFGYVLERGEDESA